jgi:FtsP/CotA-like multicopper oxidase with cupredoxin domain
MKVAGFARSLFRNFGLGVTLFSTVLNLVEPPSLAAQTSPAAATTPIQHVIIIIGENRSFDHVYATYKPKHRQTVSNLLSRGIVNADGTPGTEDPKAGSIEIWSFVNATGDVHPIHLHLVQFQVLNRQPFDVKTFVQTGKLIFTGIPMPPEANERPGWKDTVKTYAGYVTRVIQKFDLPEGAQATPGQEFRYVWHCHILEHEDNQMMRPYKVIA